MEINPNDLLDSFPLQYYLRYFLVKLLIMSIVDCKPYCLMLYNDKCYLRRKSIQINCIKKNWMGDSSNILFIYTITCETTLVSIIYNNHKLQYPML